MEVLQQQLDEANAIIAKLEAEHTDAVEGVHTELATARGSLHINENGMDVLEMSLKEAQATIAELEAEDKLGCLRHVLLGPLRRTYRSQSKVGQTAGSTVTLTCSRSAMFD